jgi:hypothetical protein
MKLLNAFTPAMVDLPATVRFEEITEENARAIAAHNIESCVGHQGAADLYGAKLGVPIAVNRVNTKLLIGDAALLGQYSGPRLPEGKILSAEEFAAAGVKWILVTVRE